MIRKSIHASRFAMSCALSLTLATCAPPDSPLDCIVSAPPASLPRALREASGVTVDSRNRIWVIADSDTPFLFQIDDRNAIAQRVRVADATVTDWEDLAAGPCDGAACLFIAEIGDNRHDMETRSVLRVPEPAAGDSVVRATVFTFRFPDGPSDAEALAVLADGTLLIITKGRNRAIGVYRYPPPLRADSIITLERIASLSEGIVQLPAQITGAAAPVDTDLLLLRSYSAAQPYRLTADGVVPLGVPFDLSSLAEPQGEGIALTDAGVLVLVGEAPGGGTIARLRCALPQ